MKYNDQKDSKTSQMGSNSVYQKLFPAGFQNRSLDSFLQFVVGSHLFTTGYVVNVLNKICEMYMPHAYGFLAWHILFSIHSSISRSA
jgi:hypothetical protein